MSKLLALVTYINSSSPLSILLFTTHFPVSLNKNTIQHQEMAVLLLFSKTCSKQGHAPTTTAPA
jgi:hypothetical protein